MKQLLPLFLFLLLLPCLVLAQYPSNGNQKITLGEQTTADGLIYRGVLADTGIITPSRDTSAYIILDTVNHRFYNYNRATNVWSMAGVGSISSGLTGVLPVANGGTGSTSFESGNIPFSNGSILTSDTSFFWDNTNKRLGISFKSPAYKVDINSGTSTSLNALRLTTSATSGSTGSSSLVIDNTTVTSNIGNSYGILMKTNASATGFYVTNSGALGAQRSLINNLQSTVSALSVTTERTSGSTGQSLVDINTSTITSNVGSSYAFRVNTQSNNHTFAILNNGNVGLSTSAPTEELHIVGNARITAMNGIGDIGADANGVLQAASSDMNLKNTIENSPFGLNEILLLNPVTFLYNDTDRKIDSDVKEVGFIAQDVFDIIPNAVSSTGTGDLQLDYRAITATLTKAIQEQQALIKALEQRIINLENK
jgi:hypothetical protein